MFNVKILTLIVRSDNLLKVSIAETDVLVYFVIFFQTSLKSWLNHATGMNFCGRGKAGETRVAARCQGCIHTSSSSKTRLHKRMVNRRPPLKHTDHTTTANYYTYVWQSMLQYKT